MCPPSGHAIVHANCCIMCQVFGVTGIGIRWSLPAQSHPCRIPNFVPPWHCDTAVSSLMVWGYPACCLLGVCPLLGIWQSTTCAPPRGEPPILTASEHLPGKQPQKLELSFHSNETLSSLHANLGINVRLAPQG